MATKKASEDETKRDTTANLEGGPDATDSLGVKKNVVGPNHDAAPADNSPTTDDIHDDRDRNITDARDEGFRRGKQEQEDAKAEPAPHPYDSKNGIG